tara:strand:+ start:369 stop:1037 length:669 start_codon:yes stop_codon:yes gene_type:complete
MQNTCNLIIEFIQSFRQSFGGLIDVTIGALIGVFLSGTAGRITTARKLNRTRKLLLSVLDSIIIPKCQTYIDDCNQGIEFVETYHNLTNSVLLDNIPMFNSEIFKAISPEILLLTCYDQLTHKNVVSGSYAIDFLRENLVHPMLDEYKQRIYDHLLKKEVSEKDYSDHIRTCESCIEFKESAMSDIKIKIGTATELKGELEQVRSSLRGKSIVWFFKYLCKQ